MAAKKRAAAKEELPDDIGMLDDLIGTLYRSLREKLGEDGKLGDLLKMIELRRKLAPQDSAQRKFWEMMNRIRTEEMPKARSGSKNEEAGSATESSAKAVSRTMIRKGTK